MSDFSLPNLLYNFKWYSNESKTAMSLAKLEHGQNRGGIWELFLAPTLILIKKQNWGLHSSNYIPINLQRFLNISKKEPRFTRSHVTELLKWGKIMGYNDVRVTLLLLLKEQNVVS